MKLNLITLPIVAQSLFFSIVPRHPITAFLAMSIPSLDLILFWMAIGIIAIELVLIAIAIHESRRQSQSQTFVILLMGGLLLTLLIGGV